MEGIDLINSWKIQLDNSIKATWVEFCHNKKIILTESDLKCHLYSELLKRQLTPPYGVHSEVTHYHIQEQQTKEIRKYRFRDIAILNPSKIQLSEELWQKEEDSLNKGFKHQGEAILIELKFDRQNDLKIAPIDIANLKNYRPHTRYPKIFYIIWGSNNKNFKALKNLMAKELNELIKPHERTNLLNHIYGVVFDTEELAEFKFVQSDKKVWGVKECSTLNRKSLMKKYISNE